LRLNGVDESVDGCRKMFLLLKQQRKLETLGQNVLTVTA
jgi:hypothetical protein